jgi:hypothetical protein
LDCGKIVFAGKRPNRALEVNAMHRFTAGTVREIVGLTPKEFRLWCESGAAAPIAGGEGTGNHRKFTLTQVLGMAVAAELRRSERGAAMDYIAKVIAAFGGITERWLEEQFARGETHFVTVHHDLPLLRGKQYEWPDVRAALAAIKTKVRELEVIR